MSLDQGSDPRQMLVDGQQIHAGNLLGPGAPRDEITQPLSSSAADVQHAVARLHHGLGRRLVTRLLDWARHQHQAGAGVGIGHVGGQQPERLRVALRKRWP